MPVKKPPAFKLYTTVEAVQYNSLRSKQRAELYFEIVQKYALDEEKDNRLDDRECRTCYYIYGGRISGQAFTNYECGICHCEFSWPNTGVPELCMKCSDDNELCCRCGARLDA